MIRNITKEKARISYYLKSLIVRSLIVRSLIVRSLIVRSLIVRSLIVRSLIVRSLIVRSLIVKREIPSFFTLVVGIYLYSSTEDNHSTAELFIHFPFALPENIVYRSYSDSDSNQHVYSDCDYIFFIKRENENFKKFYLIFIAEIKKHTQSLQSPFQIILELGKLTEFLDLGEYQIEWKKSKLQKLFQSLKCSFAYFLHTFQCLSALSSPYDLHITHNSYLLIGGEK